MKLLALLVLSASYCLSQTSGPATSKGTCSPATTGNNNTFTITCGIDKDQGDQMLKILNKILADRLDPSTVMEKLDEILHAVNPNAPKITYLINGGYRSISPGVFNVSPNPLPEFAQLASLNDQHKWTELSQLSEKAIHDHPGWFTPVALAGIAYLNMGQKEKALGFLKQADEGMAGNRDYGSLVDDVKRILSTVK